MFVILLTLLFFAVASLSLFDREKTQTVAVVYAIIVALLILFPAFKPIGVDADSDNYLDYYYGTAIRIQTDAMEFTFNIISDIAHNVFQSYRFIFVAYALLCVPLRGWAIVRNTEFWFLSLLVWMSNAYLFQDITQVRVSVSAAAFMLGLSYLAKGERWKHALCIVVAICFHYSTAALLPTLFLGNKRLSKRWLNILAITPLVGYAMHFAGVDIFSFIPIPFLSEKIEIYQALRDDGTMGDEINVFNIIFLIKLAVFYFLLWKHELIEARTRNFPLLIKVYAISFLCFTGLSAFPVMAFRLSEMFSIVDIILIPYIAYAIRPENVAKFAVIALCVGIYFLNVFYNKLLVV